MTIAPRHVDDFLEMFRATCDHIRSFPGCTHLELWRDYRYPNVLTTYSVWTGKDALEAYRQSELFESTWSRTRKWFAAPPIAASHERVEPI